MPDPGPELIERVAGIHDRDGFLASGRESVLELERTLAIADRSLDSFESILDFGCGCGRMLLWMAQLGRVRALHGTDIDAEAIAWCREHLPYARVSVNTADPPLPYADGAFDLVFNHSVFSHIDERRQDMWLTELQRVARPGALLVLSVHGEAALPQAAWTIRDRLERDGIAFIENSHPPEFPLRQLVSSHLARALVHLRALGAMVRHPGICSRRCPGLPGPRPTRAPGR
jgi:SAM-dependent methyltransferase